MKQPTEMVMDLFANRQVYIDDEYIEIIDVTLPCGRRQSIKDLPGFVLKYYGSPIVEIWYNNGVIHRADKPAVWVAHCSCYNGWVHPLNYIYKSLDMHGCCHGSCHGLPILPFTWRLGVMIWYNDGYPLVNDEPNVVMNDVIKLYLNCDGVLHRDNAPAVINECFLQWWQHGVPSRDNDKPTHIYHNRIEWRNDSGLHRENGPAVIYKDRELWYTRNVRSDEPLWHCFKRYQNGTVNGEYLIEKICAASGLTDLIRWFG
jgi:hypothetical protein